METVLVLLRKFLRGSLLILGWGLLVGSGLCSLSVLTTLPNFNAMGLVFLLPCVLIGLAGWGLVKLADHLARGRTSASGATPED